MFAGWGLYTSPLGLGGDTISFTTSFQSHNPSLSLHCLLLGVWLPEIVSVQVVENGCFMSHHSPERH